MPKIAIIVSFEAKPGKEDELAAHLDEHARRTRAEEPGCLRFDVLRAIDADGTRVAGRLIANELYADAAAAAAHAASPRLPGVRATTDALVSGRHMMKGELD